MKYLIAYLGSGVVFLFIAYVTYRILNYYNKKKENKVKKACEQRDNHY